MAPVAASLVSVLAILGAVEASPTLTPGRHAPPLVANILSSSRRGLHSMLSRYYGTSHGLTRPAPLPTKRDATLPSGWGYTGCMAELSNTRLIDDFEFSSSSNTPLYCINQCASRGYTIAGVEFGDECYCSNFYNGNPTVVSDSTCSTPCAGDSSEDCGNAYFLSVYTFNSTESDLCHVTNSTGLASQLTAVVPTDLNTTYTDLTDASEWYSLGCAVDSSVRLLTGYYAMGLSDLTIDSCLTTCEDMGYTFAGLEYGDQCWCGSSVPSTITYNDAGCNMECSGDSTEMCGGGYALDLYELLSSGTSSSSNSSSAANSTEVCTTEATTATATASLTVAVDVANPTGATTTTTTTTGAATAATAATTVATALPSAQTTVAADSTSVPASSASHYVWVHHMVGNTYPYTESNWASDVSLASSYGIDGFALNMGSDSWQPARVSDAYTAAENSGTGFKLFLSLDMTSLSCASSSDAANLVSLVAAHASSSAQATYNGKVLVSTFAGSDCTFGTGSNSAWQTLFVDALSSQGIDIFFMPSIFSDVSTFSSNTWMDGELNWNSAWPMGDYDINTSSDSTYMSALGSKEYMPAISPFFFTHFGADTYNKNWIYRSDDWLYCERWEEVIALRNSVHMTEILTWNDYGESSYIGPIEGALPITSDTWVDGFDHTGINALTQYYATAFKTGAYPTITTDTIVMWSRPHPKGATASSDSVGEPTNSQWTDDNLYAVVLATAPAVVTLTSGSTSQTFSVSAGLSKLKMSSSVGSIGGTITRNGATVASYSSGSAFSYTDSPSTYNFNYFIGSSS